MAIVGFVGLGVVSCRAGLEPAEVAATSRAVAQAKRNPSLPKTYLLGSMLDDRSAFPWVGTELPLSRRGPSRQPKARLVADLVDARGQVTEFTVDTGTSISCLSTSSMAALTAIRGAPEDASKYKDGSSAGHGTLPTLLGGAMRATLVPVLLVQRRHDLSDSTNLFGMTWMAGLALVHDVDGDRWRFVPGGSIPSRAGWSEVRMEAKALPVVRLMGPRGESAYALIDTGAPKSLSERGTACGAYHLVDATNRVAMDVQVSGTAPWKNLDPGGRHVTVWIGLQDLESRSWVMDFSTGVWSIAPVATVVASRVPSR